MRHALSFALAQYGSTPLHLAASRGQPAVTRLLLGAGADASAQNSYGYTPLHDASTLGCVATATLLLAHGAPIGTLNSEGEVNSPRIFAEICANRSLIGCVNVRRRHSISPRVEAREVSPISCAARSHGALVSRSSQTAGPRLARL